MRDRSIPAIQQLDKVTQQNASASEQMSATSEELAAQAEQLQSSITYFRIETTSGARPMHAPAVAHSVPRRPAAAVVQGHAPARHATAATAKQRAPGPRPNAHAGNGFVLELAAADDGGQDKDFVRY